MLLKCAAIHLIPFDSGLTSKSSQRDCLRQENMKPDTRENLLCAWTHTPREQGSIFSYLKYTKFYR